MTYPFKLIAQMREERDALLAELDQLRAELEAIQGQRPVAWVTTAHKPGVSEHRALWHGEDGADYWINHLIGRGCRTTKTALYAGPTSLVEHPAGTTPNALPPSPPEAITDTQRLDFILRKCRKVIVERLPNNCLEVYVEEGFMGETQHPVIAHRGDWAEASAEAAAVKRKAIDAAILWCETDGDAAKDGTV